MPAPTAAPHHPGIADLLRQPPPPGASVEVDAYFSAAEAPTLPGGGPPPPDQIRCPFDPLLTDQPYPVYLFILNETRGNPLPDDAPWLIATTPEATQPGNLSVPALPYHARLRGHFGEAAFAHCDHAARIFVVESTVQVYEQHPPTPPAFGPQLPADYPTWPRYRDAAMGYSLPYPPDWSVESLNEPDVLSAVALRAPQWPDSPMLVRVHDGETQYDQYNPASTPPLLQRQGWGVFAQDGIFHPTNPENQHLTGFLVERQSERGTAEEAVIISAHGRTYELALRFRTGFDVAQPLLDAYSAMVVAFRLDQPPGPTPTPPIKQRLGAGPFLSQEAALARVRTANEREIELIEAQLLSEAAARAQVSACATFFGHPDGVWMLMVRGTFEDAERTMRLLLDAESGEQLCGEELSSPPAATEGMPLGTTATPIPTRTPAPAGSPAPTTGPLPTAVP